MSRHVYWPNRPHRERSPFELGDLSPVRVTEYYPLRSHTASTDQAEEPIRCLRELGQRGLVDVVGSHADGPSRLEISERVTESEASGYRALTVHEPTAGRSTGIVRLEIWRHTEATLQARLRDVAADHLSSVLTIAAAHEALGNDLLSTTDGVLLQLRDEPTLLRLNVCTPAEACRIVGLLLRTREDYPINHYFSVDREGFYWPLMRHRLPAMWPYFSACVLSDPQRRDGILYLGQTVLSRASGHLKLGTKSALSTIALRLTQPPTG
jgi:hypothetical protein